MEITVKSPIGIEIVSPTIYDAHGLFYENHGIRRINLPIGKYIINGSFRQIPFINYPLPPVPFPEKIYSIPKVTNIRVEFVENLPYKGQIDIHRNVMELNADMKSTTSPEFFCVFYHELGHYKYKTEYKCDLYAIRRMLMEGFNPSQFQAFLHILKHSEGRKEIAIRTAKNSDYESNDRSNSSRNRLYSLFHI